MPAIDDQAIVLRLTDYSESSQIVSLFGAEHGLLRLIAKGTRRSTRSRVAVGLDLLELGEVSFVKPREQAGLGTLTRWRLRDGFLALRRDLALQYAGFYAAELTLRLTAEYDPHPELFAALLRLLRELCDLPGAGQNRVAELVVRFQAALLRSIGYGPRLRECVDCQRPRPRRGPVYFSSQAGGLLCRDCAPRHHEKRPLELRWLEPPAARQAPLYWFELLDYHLAHLAGGPPRTAAVLCTRLGAKVHPRAT